YYKGYTDSHDLHSFPTRRSSDLMSRQQPAESSRAGLKSLTDARVTRIPDEAFAFQMKDNFLGRLVRSELGRIDGYVRIGRVFVGIRDAGKLLDNAGASFGVEVYGVWLL